MSGTATLGGVAATRVVASVPAWGRMWADVRLAEPTLLAGTLPLVIADATFVVTIVSGGVVDGAARYRVVAGAGGWGKTIKRKGYVNDAGVKASLVLADAARECGETLGSLASLTSTVGVHYARTAGTDADAIASDVLNYVSPRAWYIDTAGVTQLGARATVAYADDAPRVRVDLATGVIELATNVIGVLAPGVVVDGHAPATDVEYDLDAKRLVVRVYFAPQRDRLIAAFGKIVDALDPRRHFRGVYEFRVVTQTGERLNLQPVRVASGMPDLTRVPVRPGVSGTRSNVTPGELVLVAFADGDPGRPAVIAHDAPDAPGWMPLTIELGGPGALGVARMTDPVIAGPFAGTIVSGSARVKASL